MLPGNQWVSLLSAPSIPTVCTGVLKSVFCPYKTADRSQWAEAGLKAPVVLDCSSLYWGSLGGLAPALSEQNRGLVPKERWCRLLPGPRGVELVPLLGAFDPQTNPRILSTSVKFAK